jgi:hypothetical protein
MVTNHRVIFSTYFDRIIHSIILMKFIDLFFLKKSQNIIKLRDCSTYFLFSATVNIRLGAFLRTSCTLDAIYFLMASSSFSVHI